MQAYQRYAGIPEVCRLLSLAYFVKHPWIFPHKRGLYYLKIVNSSFTMHQSQLYLYRVSIFLVFILSHLHVNAQIDSLQNLLSKKDTSAVLAGYELGKIYISKNLDSSYQFFLDAALLAGQLNYTHGKIVTYRAIGSVAPRIEKYDDAFHWLNKGIRLIDSLELEPGNKVDFLTNLGVVYYRQGLIGNAIEPYIEAVDICQEHGLDDRRSRLLNNLGIFYRMLEQYEDALKIYDQSYSLREAEKDTMGMANTLYNMAASHAKINQAREAINKLEKAESLYASISSEMDVLTCKVARGTAYVDLNQMKNAENSFKEALSNPKIRDLQNPFNINLYHGIASIEIYNNNPVRAEKALRKITDDIDSQADNEQALINQELWSKVYALKGQYKKAYETYLAFRSNTDTLLADERLKLRQEMETKYLTKEKEYEIDLLNTENELNEVKLKASYQRLIGMGIGLVIFGGLLIWLFSLLRKTKIQNTIISKANKEKEVLLKEIHHRVKNNLQVVSSLLTLQSKYVDDDTALAAINTGKSRVQSMSILHRNLYQNENLKNIKIKPYFDDLVENLVETYQVGDKDISIKSEVEDIELDVDTVIPMGLITNELISNALKYAFTGKDAGKICLAINESEGNLYLSVSDDGIGIPFTEIPKRSKTLGMQLIHSFSKKLKGKITITKQPGTTVSILFPLKYNPYIDIKSA
jgi:two-component sensor histidine kinase